MEDEEKRKDLDMAALERTLVKPSMMYTNTYVAWKKPDKIEQFHFPRILIKIWQRDQDGKVKAYLKGTSGQFSDFPDAVAELFSDFLHPNMRGFYYRTLYDQWQKIELSEEYQETYKEFRQWTAKNV